MLAGAATGLALVGGALASNFIGGEKKIERHVERLYTLDDARFMNDLGVLLGPPFLAGTRVQALLNGEQIFPPMLAAIRAAQVSINFETYIYWSGDIGREFAEALAERARQGVKVHVLLDWVGSAKMDPSLICLGRLDQFRQSLLPPQRRGHAECDRRGLRERADRDFRGRPREVASGDSCAVAGAPLARTRRRNAGLRAGPAALRLSNRTRWPCRSQSGSLPHRRGQSRRRASRLEAGYLAQHLFTTSERIP